MEAFDRAFALVVGEEGGYVNDPTDPGGETKYGISKRSNPDVDIKNLTLDGAKKIYRGVWDNVRGDELPWPLAAYVFDAAVNQGPQAAVKTLQHVLGIEQDGEIGTHTLVAVSEHDWEDGLPRYLAQRAMRYAGTRNFLVYGEGWLFRLFRLSTTAANPA